MLKKYKHCRLVRVKIVSAVGYNAKKIYALSPSTFKIFKRCRLLGLKILSAVGEGEISNVSRGDICIGKTTPVSLSRRVTIDLQ